MGENEPTLHSIVETIRQEPFNLFSLRRNCIGKSFKFKKACRQIGISARVVISLSIVHNKRFKWLPPIMLSIYGCAEVRGRKIRLVKSPDGLTLWGTPERDERPLIAVWI